MRALTRHDIREGDHPLPDIVEIRTDRKSGKCIIQGPVAKVWEHINAQKSPIRDKDEHESSRMTVPA